MPILVENETHSSRTEYESVQPAGCSAPSLASCLVPRVALGSVGGL